MDSENGLLVRARVVDRFLVGRQRDGVLPSYSSFEGEEAAIVGAVLGIADGDWIFPTARDFVCAALVRNAPLATLFRQILGRVGDPAKGRQPPGAGSMKSARIASVSALHGAHLPHATGAAWAAKNSGKGDAVLALFGEGATSTGDFHNALNFAGVFRAPVVFLCRNHGLATATPVERQTRTETFAEKAIAYGLHSVVVDGHDVVAVREAVTAARAKAIAGERATLIEAVTAPSPFEEALDDDAALVGAIEREVAEAWADAEAALAPPREWLFQDVFADEKRA